MSTGSWRGSSSSIISTNQEQIGRDQPPPGLPISVLRYEATGEHVHGRHSLQAVSVASRAEFVDQKERFREEHEGGPDTILLLQQSFVYDQGLRACQVPTEEDITWSLEDENAENVTYAGVVSFGRKDGHAAFTMASYCRLLPRGDSAGQQQARAELGYAYISVVDGLATETIRTVGTTDSPELMAEYASGLTRDAVEFIVQACDFDRVSAPLVERFLEEHPFNTMTSYLWAQGYSSDERRHLYNLLAEDATEHFAAYGGSCFLSSLSLAGKLKARGMRTAVGLYTRPGTDLEVDHGNLVTTDTKLRYVFDPGLRIPYAIPVGEIPLLPFATDKSIAVLVEANEQTMPCIAVLAGDKVAQFNPCRMFSTEQFREVLPRVLADYHSGCAQLVLEYLHADGSKKVGVSIRLESHKLTIRDRDGVRLVMDLSGFDVRARRELEVICASQGIDPSSIIGQLAVATSIFNR